MSTQIRPSDGAAVAASVRALAKVAHRIFRNTHPDANELRELSHKLAQLQHALRSQPASDLARWVENLREQVESRTLPEDPPAHRPHPECRRGTQRPAPVA